MCREKYGFYAEHDRSDVLPRDHFYFETVLPYLDDLHTVVSFIELSIDIFFLFLSNCYLPSKLYYKNTLTHIFFWM